MRNDFNRAEVHRGLLREAGSYVAHALIYGFGYLPSRHRPQRARELRTLVFVHGLGGNRSSFFPLQTYLWMHGFRRQLSFNYRLESSIEAMAIQLKTRLKREVRGGRIDLICHSMGGLVARYYLQVLGGHRRVDRFITLATPHHGTHPSVYIPSSLTYQFKPSGPFIHHLNSLPPPPPHVRCVSIAAGRDYIVLPPESGLLPFGDTKTFADLGHVELLMSRRVFSTVHGALNLPSIVAAARQP